MESYESLLDKAYSELPATVKEHSRFVTPVMVSMIQGKITVVQNLGEVSKAINREAGMLAKYLARELGTSGNTDGQHLFLKGQFRQSQVQEKFEEFLNQFVLCPECKKPDTRIIKEERVSILKCEACGSRHPLSAIKALPREESTKPNAGDEVVLQITGTGKRGDGVARLGEYLVFVSNAREGQRVKAKITKVQGNMIFASAVGPAS